MFQRDTGKKERLTILIERIGDDDLLDPLAPGSDHDDDIAVLQEQQNCLAGCRDQESAPIKAGRAQAKPTFSSAGNQPLERQHAVIRLVDEANRCCRHSLTVGPANAIQTGECGLTGDDLQSARRDFDIGRLYGSAAHRVSVGAHE